jgi:hypothetical protein
MQGELSAQLEAYTSADVGADAVVLDLTLKALIFDVIHMIEIVDLLIRDNIDSLQAWAWQKQLRYYLTKKGCCDACCVFVIFIDPFFIYRPHGAAHV